MVIPDGYNFDYSVVRLTVSKILRILSYLSLIVEKGQNQNILLEIVSRIRTL